MIRPCKNAILMAHTIMSMSTGSPGGHRNRIISSGLHHAHHGTSKAQCAHVSSPRHWASRPGDTPKAADAVVKDLNVQDDSLSLLPVFVFQSRGSYPKHSAGCMVSPRKPGDGQTAALSQVDNPPYIAGPTCTKNSQHLQISHGGQRGPAATGPQAAHARIPYLKDIATSCLKLFS